MSICLLRPHFFAAPANSPVVT